MTTVLITGAAGGLGRALTRVFHARGDRLYLVDRDPELLDELLAELNDADRVGGQVADLSTSQGVADVVDGFQRHFGELDVLVNNAGITHRSPAADTDPDVFRRVMAVDWQAPVQLSLALLPGLRQRNGSIINIGSMAGWMPVPGRAGYCSAKAALTQFFEVLRAEQQDRGLHILMVYPSFLDTAIETNALGADGNPARHARSTVGRVANADTLAVAITRALDKRRASLFPDRFTRVASLLWRLAPGLFHRLLRRRFRVELEQRE